MSVDFITPSLRLTNPLRFVLTLLDVTNNSDRTIEPNPSGNKENPFTLQHGISSPLRLNKWGHKRMESSMNLWWPQCHLSRKLLLFPKTKQKKNVNSKEKTELNTLCNPTVDPSVPWKSSITECSFWIAKSSIFCEILDMGNNLFATCN